MSTVDVVWAQADGSAGQADDLLRREIARSVGMDVRIDRLCPSCGSGEHGQPFLTSADRVPLFVSLSRSPEVVAVAFTESGAIGIDVERADAPSFAGFEGVVLHPDENASTIRDRATTWVRKESLLKATGHGLDVDPSTIRLSGPHEEPRLLVWNSAKPRPAYVRMRDVQIDADHVAAVTLLSEKTPEFRVREAAPEAPAD